MLNFKEKIMRELKCSALFLCPDTSAAYEEIQSYEYPWQVLPHIKSIILDIGSTLTEDEYLHPAPDVWISKGAKVAPTAQISGPTVIMEGAEIRHCAFIRGSALVGRGAVVGNSCELKNCILFDGAQIPHFNYVGDSIIGHRSHMGAGAITSNLKSDKTLVSVTYNGQRVETGVKKFGAILADNVEVGCNSVLNPGTVIGTRTNVYPLSSVRGYIPSDSIFKSQGNIVKKHN